MIPESNEQGFDFLSLPPEIRIQIYDYLLVHRVGSLLPIQIDSMRLALPRSSRLLSPEILRACKQIYAETRPILYGMNHFSVSKPDEISTLLPNLEHLRTLYLRVPWWSVPMPWVRLFHTLSEHAHGLKFLSVVWEKEHGYSRISSLNSRPAGLGCNLNFVRALATVKQMDRLEIAGWFAHHWPAYLQHEMGDHVQFYAEPGTLQSRFSPPIPDDLTTPEEWEELRRFQEGTEDLNPWALPSSADI